MADAEIIPLGTRGKPGRGSGREKPSATSRNLAPGARSSQPPAQPASQPAAQSSGTPSASPADPQQAQNPGAADRSGAERPAPYAEQAAAAPASGAQRSGAQAGSDAASASGPLADASAGASDGGAGSAADSVVSLMPDTAPPTAAPVVVGEGGLKVGPIPVGDLLNAATQAALDVFGDDAERKLAQMLAFLRRRVTGDYEVDEYGLDPEITENFLLALVRPLATKWFRVEVRGVENIPTEGGALVVANHSGTIPVDGLVTLFAVHETTGRHLRPLGADLVFRLPFIGELARKGGATLACNEDAIRMLSRGELAAVWPEGFKGIGKPYSERYKLQRFGRGGFVSAAIRTGVPIVPCSIVGAEEIYPLVGNVPALARLLGVPYIPITPFFPLLGPLGLVPLPSKWIIEFGEPIRTDSYEPGAADDPMLVFNLTDQVRETIQQTLYSLLMRRKSVFH